MCLGSAGSLKLMKTFWLCVSKQLLQWRLRLSSSDTVDRPGTGTPEHTATGPLPWYALITFLWEMRNIGMWAPLEQFRSLPVREHLRSILRIFEAVTAVHQRRGVEVAQEQSEMRKLISECASILESLEPGQSGQRQLVVEASEATWGYGRPKWRPGFQRCRFQLRSLIMFDGCRSVMSRFFSSFTFFQFFLKYGKKAEPERRHFPVWSIVLYATYCTCFLLAQ